MLLRNPSEPGSPARDDHRDADGRRPADEENPFAPPPENQPSQEGRWSDRQPEGGGGGGWSGWGQRPEGSGQGHRSGQGGSGEGPGGPGLRWDPTDPAQRRARYALLSGTWGLILTLFGLPYVALLLGALALYWGISALRTPSRPQDPDRPADGAAATASGSPTATGGRNPQRRAAIVGIVTGSIALLMVLLFVLAQQVLLRDFFVCTDEALTRDARQACVKHLPDSVPDSLRDSLTAST
ncbi:hypothetical protein [Streptomyces fragilis]|uniref:Integral membrane protein n=1 Tax=Streptomyces fragilis TaxID=67301 RepID=A0ABV2YII6_9ACTN|nr:hypothetical protein [Streptomyces fragilis]